MAFMFETRCAIRPTKFALESPQLQRDYSSAGRGSTKHFDPAQP